MRIIKPKEIEKEFFEYEENNLSSVKEILEQVKKEGDRSLKRYTYKFDRVSLKKIKVDEEEIETAYQSTSPEIIKAINFAAENIENFAKRQISYLKEFRMEIVPGVFAEQRITPIERVGIYVPAGRFPLVSTLLMCGIPAKVAGVREIIVCSPPSFKGSVHPSILAASKIIGIDEVYAVGGAQAIGAMAYGTETIKKVDKIVGPGNKYVISAKKRYLALQG